MEIKLIKLSLLNFKGVRSLNVRFQDVTNIWGDNATGKTTVFDAFLWLLFGKDSTDRKAFEIKTLGPDNKPFHRMDHEVTALIEIDGEEINLKKVYKEKWVKKRGEIEPLFSGHENIFYWNDVPLKEEDYQRKISTLLNENIFKLITNTSYFNSRTWQERRNVLLELAGEISNDEVFDSLHDKLNELDYAPLMNAFKVKKSVDEFKKEIGVKKKKIKDELILIPSRIDEADRSLPELLNYDELTNSLASYQAELQNIETQLLNRTAAQKERQEIINNKLLEMQDLRMKLQAIEFAEKNKVQDNKRTREQEIINLRRDLRNKLDDAQRNAIEISNNNARKTALQAKQTELRGKWTIVNNQKLEFKETEFTCPTCKRAYEASNIEEKKAELTRNFNANKSSRLAEISTDGKRLAGEIVSIDQAIEIIKSKDTSIQTQAQELQQKIATAEQQNSSIATNESLEVIRHLAGNPEYTSLKERIALLDGEVNIKPLEDNAQAQLLAGKKDLAGKIDQVKKDLSSKEQRGKTEARIIELKTQEREMGQELANLEGIEYSIEQFMKAKMDTLESRINGRFQIVTFKLFREQINLGEVECCDTLIKGVPYIDANNAAKIQAGLDIINTLTDHFKVTAPVFIDNRESVVTIPHSHSQIINLIVSAADKKLRVDSEKLTLTKVA